MSNPHDEEIAALTGTIGIALDKIYGEQMAAILITVPSVGGRVDLTTNIGDDASLIAILEHALLEHSGGRFNEREFMEPTKQ